MSQVIAWLAMNWFKIAINVKQNKNAKPARVGIIFLRMANVYQLVSLINKVLILNIIN